MTLHVKAPLIHRASEPLPELARNRPVTLNVASRGLELGPVGRLMGSGARQIEGKIKVDLQVAGTVGRPTVRARVQGSGLRLGQIKDLDGVVALDVGTDETHLRLAAKRDGKQTLRVQAQAGLGTGELIGSRSFGPRNLFGKPLKLDLEIGPTALESWPRLHRLLGRTRGTLAGKVSVEGRIRDLKGKVDLKVARAVFDRHQLGDLRAQATVGAEGGKTQVDLKLEAGKVPLLRASGGVDAMPLDLASAGRIAGAPITLNAQIPAVRLEKLPVLGELFEGIAGGLSAQVEATGTVGSPQAKAVLELKEARFASGVAAVDLKVEGSYDGKTVQAALAGAQAGQGGGRLKGTARLDLTGKQARVDADIEAQRVDMSSLAGIVPVIREAQGTLDLVLSAKGPLSKPQLNGRVAFAGPRLRVQGMSPLRNIQLVARLSPDRVSLDKLRVASGKGSLDGVWSGNSARPTAPDLQTGAAGRQVSAGCRCGQGGHLRRFDHVGGGADATGHGDEGVGKRWRGADAQAGGGGRSIRHG